MRGKISLWAASIIAAASLLLSSNAYSQNACFNALHAQTYFGGSCPVPDHKLFGQTVCAPGYIPCEPVIFGLNSLKETNGEIEVSAKACVSYLVHDTNDTCQERAGVVPSYGIAQMMRQSPAFHSRFLAYRSTVYSSGVCRGKENKFPCNLVLWRLRELDFQLSTMR